MRLVIDLQGAQTPASGHRGVGRYALELTNALSRSARHHEIIPILNGTFEETIDQLRYRLSEWLPQSAIRVWSQYFDTAAITSPPVARRAGEILREEFIRTLGPDVVFVPNLQEGYSNPAVTSIDRDQYLNVVTIHDLIPLRYSQRYLANKPIREWYLSKLEAAKNSDLILADSIATRNDILEYLRVSENRVKVVYLAHDHEGFDAKTTEAGPQTLRRLGVDLPFFLYVGGDDENKNLELLFKALSQVDLPEQLIICGREPKANEQRHKTKLRGLSISSKVRFLGHVSDRDLRALYACTSSFVMPSRFEGFGLPPLEAMAGGAPVLSSTGGSLAEVVTNPEAQFDPMDNDRLSGLLRRCSEEPDFRDKLRVDGEKDLRRFSWNKSAEEFWTVVEEAADRKRHRKVGRSPLQSAVGRLKKLSVNSLSDNDLRRLSQSVADSLVEVDRSSRVFLDVSATFRQDDKTGIQRVTRAVARGLLRGPLGADVHLVQSSPSDAEFYFATDMERRLRDDRGHGALEGWVEFRPGDVLVFLDLHLRLVISKKEKIRWLRNRGIRTFHVVFDLLPVSNPEWFFP